MDCFYEDNIGNPKIAFFEKARIKLKKLLMYNPDKENKTQSDVIHGLRRLTFSHQM
jgi:hypothetical protein